MNLIDLYIQEVTRWLPKDERKDIALELESAIYDMLPENYGEEDVYQVLEVMGDPAVLANKYREKPMHLIGPKYYDVYMSLLKIILPIAIVISLLTVVGVEFLNSIEDNTALQTLLSLIGDVISNVITASIQAFVWLTVIFALIERVDGMNDGLPRWMGFKSWSPEHLKQAKNVSEKKAIKTSEVYARLIWTAFWGTGYFYADHLLGIYENGANGLRLVIPVFNQDVLMSFWTWIVLLIGAEVVLAIYKLIKKQWSQKLATFNMIYEFVSAVIFIIILTRADLFTVEFLTQLSDWFNLTLTNIKNILVGGSITITLVHSGISIIDRFRKANVKTS
ncbi:hypothetical protein SAMN05421676_107150 [Salinibacillus kushneri]|uniref:Uncharacterized protein n=1 Tax=Salinibacillus kushneri TaxID=237682 RepID=A0A1I0GSS9_9BACI|nr:hypothetical protein [Salinibacillus kushneri]SET74189.1 hypothetical protein SAMN05421676_107150 [Salinibacillus kushneri]